MPKTATQLRLYPRGFLGAEIAPQIERTPKPFLENITRAQFHVQDFKTMESDLFANPHVENLYAEYIKQSARTESFEFRKKVAQVALQAFGTMNFEFWYSAQHRVPACGDLHNRFLTDTLRFIQEGRREMSLETWQNLVTITDEGDQVGGLSDYAKSFFGIGNGHFQPARFNTQLTEVLQMWLSKPNGQDDLIGTLHILFGNP
jgi:hypothetical protein